jgi:hypothetical protein
MNNIGEYLATRQKQRVAQEDQSTSSIELCVNTSNTSIELPPELERLNVGSDYWRLKKGNRYRKLIREGYLRNLLELATMAATKDNPAHWFATVCSVKQWERTLEFLAKLGEVQETAVRVAEKLATEVTKAIYWLVWRGASVERWADTAREVPHDKPGQSKIKHFAWLCRRELGGTAVADGRV